MNWLQILYCVFLYSQCEVECEENALKSKNPLPYFRRQVEEVVDHTNTDITVVDNLSANLVSLLIENVKEIYGDLRGGDSTEIPVSLSRTTDFTRSTIFMDTTVIIHNTIQGDSFEDTSEFSLDNVAHNNFLSIEISTDMTDIYSGSIETTDLEDNNILTLHQNATLVSFSNQEIIELDSSTVAYGLVAKDDLMPMPKNLMLFEADREERGSGLHSVLPFTVNATAIGGRSARSCIHCNNVALDNCNDPKHRLIPSTMCEHDDNMCYMLHTPFGIIDRGCFNPNRNLTTYVCNCNLCNYISISEMPHVFSERQDWIENVVELSRARRLRKSVLKEMSCLKCETNSSTKRGNALDAVNCLEGNIGSLPTEYCEYNEVCAVRVMKEDGYMWRGCVKFPLYNYWWSLCDTDLCNYESLVSIYDGD